MKRRSLSGNEAKLVLQLEWENEWFLDIPTIQKLLKCSKSYAYYLAHTLISKGWLEPIGSGGYLLIDAKRGYKKLAPRMSPYVVTRTLKQPYYIAFFSAAHYHHLTTQLPQVLHIAVQRQRRSFTFKHVLVQFITIKQSKFFGYEDATIENEAVCVSDLEKTLLDSLDRPDLVGGIEMIARFLVIAAPRINFANLIDYTRTLRSRALAVRLGYLLDILQIKRTPRKILEALEMSVGRDKTPIGEVRRWGKRGHLHPRWRVIENVPVNILTAELEIR
jgi:predicted transcriptional regulator of viral defense system